MSEGNDTQPELQLTQPVQFIRGVGPARAKVLEKLGLKTAADLLFFFPRKYQDFTEQIEIGQLEDGQLASVIGTVDDIDQRKSGNGRHVMYVLIKQGIQCLRGMWFNQAYLANKFAVGQRVMLQGKVKLNGGRFAMTHPRVTWIDEDCVAADQAALLPVYRLTDGINQRQMRSVTAAAVEQFAHLVEEAMPRELRNQVNVCDIQQAIKQIHAPKNQIQANQARERLVYQELFVLQLALAIRRHNVRMGSKAPSFELTPKIKSRIERRFPFELTETQQTAIQDIAADMGQAFPMNRLLHGEVGSGKTVVAVFSMLIAVAHGFQAALMAPTEILANQHFQTLQKLLAGSRVRMELLTGGRKSSERKSLLSKLEAGEIDILIGTQALASVKVNFHKLGLVVIDEQHKFGVQQRALLKQTNHDPHYLVMTATPIPRTVSMTLFGDLDVSILDRPAGVGTVVHTYLSNEESRAKWWEFFCKKLREGRQGYVVAPRVDSDEAVELGSAEKVFEALSNGPLADFRLDLLHGRQSSAEKESAMHDFNSGKTQVLVATGVVEVGINVPNATIMTIESAERFGLSQLHQLRGRVSRGKHAGYVCAFATSDDPDENQRLKAFAETNDGFKLAETDLQLRGPGNLFSTKQSGFPPLMIADLIRDEKILKRAQADARKLIASNPNLNGEEFSRLRELVTARYGQSLEISDVG